MYGDGREYMNIFEPIASQLDSPDKVFPAQGFVNPEIEET